MKIVNFAICCCAFCEALADPPAIISINNLDDLRVIDLTDNSELERFQILVYQNPKKITNGSLQFALKIDFRNFNETIRFNNEIIDP